MADIDELRTLSVKAGARDGRSGADRSRRLLLAMYGSSGAGFLLLDERRGILDLTPQLARMLGRDHEALLNADSASLLPEGLQARARAEFDAVLSGGGPNTGVWPVAHADGRILELRITLERIDTVRAPPVCLATVTDLSCERSRAREREDRAAILELVTRHAPQAQIYARIASMLERRFTDAWIAIYHCEGDALFLKHASGIPDEVLVLISRQPLDAGHGPSTAAALSGKLTATADLQTDPRWHRYRETAAAHGLHAGWSCPIPAETGDRCQGALAVLHAEKRLPTNGEAELLSETANLAGLAMSRHRLVADLSHRAFHDALTGLANRHLLEDRLTRALAHGHRGGEVAVMLIDLDDFKHVNDTLGHAAGDELLIEIAARLRERLRPADTIARLGGDEFVAMLLDTDRAGAAAVARALIDILSAPFELRGEDVQVSASIGIALGRAGADTPAGLIRAADTAMYETKARGRNGFRFHERGPLPPASHLAVLGRELRSAGFAWQADIVPVARGSRCGRLCGVRAEVLWRHPEHGLVAAERFLQIASGEGLLNKVEASAIGSLREYVLALRAPAHSVPLIYRLSAFSIRDDDFPRRLHEYAVSTGMTPRLLELDLSAGLANVADARRLPELAARLRADLPGVRIALGRIEGIHVAVDAVRAIRPDVVGIGAALLQDIDDAELDKRTAACELLRHALAIARALARRVVVEDVASAAQWSALRTLGVRMAEGPLFHALLSAS